MMFIRLNDVYEFKINQKEQHAITAAFIGKVQKTMDDSICYNIRFGKKVLERLMTPVITIYSLVRKVWKGELNS